MAGYDILTTTFVLATIGGIVALVRYVRYSPSGKENERRS